MTGPHSVTEAMVHRYRQAVEAATEEDHFALIALYGENVRFEDPISRVNGVDGVRRVIADTWKLVPRSRFVVRSHATTGDLVYVRWSLIVPSAEGERSVIEAVGELRFGSDGRVVRHVDYWDSVSAIYRRVPVLRRVLELFRRRISAGWEKAR